jgi:hypothetical protein
MEGPLNGENVTALLPGSLGHVRIERQDVTAGSRRKASSWCYCCNADGNPPTRSIGNLDAVKYSYWSPSS